MWSWPSTRNTRSRMLSSPRLGRGARQSWIEADAIVMHDELQVVIQSPQRENPQRDFHPAGLGVTGHVSQRFLRHAKQTKRHVR